MAAAVAIIPGTDEGSISVVFAHRRIVSEAATSDFPRQVDAIQEEVQQGPCLDAAYQHQTVRIPDMTTEQRWPLFAARAAKLGAASMLALQLFVEGDDLGASTCSPGTRERSPMNPNRWGCSSPPTPPSPTSAPANRRTPPGALIHRDLIGQAKGMLMERYQISGDRAFLLLTRISQNSNRKLHQVATELVETGTVTGAHGYPRHRGKPYPVGPV